MLVRYFYVPVLAGVAYETYSNGIVGLFGTLLVGLFVWGCLSILLVVVNVTSGVSQFYTEIARRRQSPYSFKDTLRPTSDRDENVVEGSIITDLDEERRKRRQEM